MQVTLAKNKDACVYIAQTVLNAGKAVDGYFDSENCFVCETEGGFAAVMVNIDTADLLDIAVLPEHRNKGVASALMEFTEGECRMRGVGEIFLEVRESNAPAISLYKKHGYEKISVRKKYYSDPSEDAVIMRKKI